MQGSSTFFYPKISLPPLCVLQALDAAAAAADAVQYNYEGQYEEGGYEYDEGYEGQEADPLAKWQAGDYGKRWERLFEGDACTQSWTLKGGGRGSCALINRIER